MDVLASAAAVIVEPEAREQQRRAEIETRLDPVVGDGGPLVVLQPIVDLTTGDRVGAEALSRFPAEWGKAPDVVFAEAHSIGRGHVLELLALRRAADHLERVGGYVAMNVSPATVLTPGFGDLLAGLPLERVLLELSEHDPVDDYAALSDALRRFRAAGLRLAIDDVGAGFSSLRHIVITAPDVIKLDRSIVTGIAADAVLPVVTRSLVDLAGAIGAKVVAEGVETGEDAAALLAAGVDLGQGWYFGKATAPGELRDAYALLTPRA